MGVNNKIICECGSMVFYFLEDYLLCPDCATEIKRTDDEGKAEIWIRRFNKKRQLYGENWEHLPGWPRQQKKD